MATYNLEGQERIDQIKSWWNKYSIVVTLILTASLVAIGGTQAWRYYQQKQAYQAADLYFLYIMRINRLMRENLLFN